MSPSTGLFHFGAAYRPVPLTQTFIGVAAKKVQEIKNVEIELAYDKAIASIRRGKQVMVFVQHTEPPLVTTPLSFKIGRSWCSSTRVTTLCAPRVRSSTRRVSGTSSRSLYPPRRATRATRLQSARYT